LGLRLLRFLVFLFLDFLGRLRLLRFLVFLFRDFLERLRLLRFLVFLFLLFLDRLRLLRFLLLERLRDFFGERLRLLFLRDLRGGMMWVLVHRKIFLLVGGGDELQILDSQTGHDKS
jgi:hypothetical protein